MGALHPLPRHNEGWARARTPTLLPSPAATGASPKRAKHDVQQVQVDGLRLHQVGLHDIQRRAGRWAGGKPEELQHSAAAPRRGRARSPEGAAPAQAATCRSTVQLRLTAMLVTVTCSTGVGVSLVGDTLVSLSRPLRQGRAGGSGAEGHVSHALQPRQRRGVRAGCHACISSQTIGSCTKWPGKCPDLKLSHVGRPRKLAGWAELCTAEAGGTASARRQCNRSRCRRRARAPRHIAMLHQAAAAAMRRHHAAHHPPHSA